MDIAANIVLLISAFIGSGAFTAWVTYRATKQYTIEQMTAETRKTNAETKKTEAEARSTDAATIDQLSDTIAEMDARWRVQRAEDASRISALEDEVKSLKQERDVTDTEVKRLLSIVRILRTGVNRLIAQLKEHEITPAWEPPDEQA